MTHEEFQKELSEIPNIELYEQVKDALSKLCSSGGNSFTMHVPPRKTDFDILFSEVLRRWAEPTALESLGEEEEKIHDPLKLLQHESMPLNSKKGTKVTVTKQTINFGYSSDKEWANKHLVVDGIYTVEKLDVGDWSSTVTLKEMPDVKFNTVHFIKF